MSQYQMHPRNATIRHLCLPLLVVWLLLATLAPYTSLLAAPPAQSQPPDESHLLLLPLGETPIELLTHTVDVAVSVGADRSLRLDVAAAYRFHNPKTADSSALLLQINTPDDGNPALLRLPQAIALESNGQPLPLQATGNGLQQTTQLTLGPDERQTLTLWYSLHFATSDLPVFVYPASALDVWPGRVGSWRVTLNFADGGSGALYPDNWLAVEPEGWSYNGSRLQWLSEDLFPQQPLRWQVVHPAIWQEIESRQQTIRQQPTAAEFSALGDIYRRLFESAGKQAAAQDPDRERFYAQALAAYSDGLSFVKQTGLPLNEGARLHQALAALYRSRSIGTDGSIDPAYVQWMMAEAAAALAALPAAAAVERSEVTGWLADGLRVQASQAQQRKEWPAAIALLDRLAALPDSPVDPAQLAEERRLLLLEQALQFLEQGNPEAVLALTGSTLATDDLLPASERQAIFARWEFSLIIRPDDLTLTGTAPAIAGREDEARQLIDQLLSAWQNARPRQGVADAQFDGKVATISLSGIAPSERLALTQATPQNTQWALLRTLLVNADAEIDTTTHLIWQRTTLRHSLDLRPVADQWSGIGASLERESLGTESAGGTEQRIRGELRAITYRQEAERWHKLARDSRVQIELAASAPAGAGPSRMWSIQLTDPPQALGYFAERVSALRLLLAVALGMAAIFVLAGILWLLL